MSLPLPKISYVLGNLHYLYVLILVFIIGVSFAPLFVKFPYYINIFLTWDGAYRMSIGQVPSIDFYMPMGFIFWIIPALIFKLISTSLNSLIVYQCFVNFATLLVFWKILKLLNVHIKVIFLSILVFGLSFIILNFLAVV